MPCSSSKSNQESLISTHTRAAEGLIQTLEALGTKNIFSLSGNQIMPIYDACIDSPINLIHTRHEAGAVHMADAWGRLTGTPGLALIAGGPGFANGLSAMYVAKMAESPLVMLSGHASLETIGRGGFQELPQAEIAANFAKASWLVEHPNEVDAALRRAFEIAQHGRPGPVHISLPSDLLEMPVTETATTNIPEIPALPTLSSESLATIVQSLTQAERPLILAGSAVMRSAEFTTAKSLCASSNLPLIGTESPRGVNDPALGAFGSIVEQADLILLVGKKLDFTLRFGQSPFIQAGTHIIHIDADADALELTRHNGDTLSIDALHHADPYVALKSLAEIMGTQPLDDAWAIKVASALAYVPPAWADLKSAEGEALFSAEIGRTIHNYLSEGEDSIMISDGGEFGQWMQALVKPPHRVINGLSGSIGVAVPMGLAARLAYPNSRIVVCSGDGGFGFLPFEIETAVRNKLPFITVIGNDSRWNAEYQIQLRDYGADRVLGVDLDHIDYHTAIQAIGGWGAQVTDVDTLEKALLAAGGLTLPACINATLRGEAAPLIRQ